MNIVLLGKLLVGGGFAVGSSILVAWNWAKITGSPYRDIFVYSKISEEEATNKVTNKDIDTIENNDANNNYRCRLENTTYLFTCNIKQLKDTNPSKNQVDYEDFESDVSSKKVLAKDKIYKISFSSNKYDWNQDGKDKIEIVSNEDKDKKYGTVDVWFVFDKEIKTTQFIGQSKTTSTAKDLSNYKCSWEDDSSSETCQVYVFSADSQDSDKEHTELTFKNNTSEAAEIKEHNHYRIFWHTNIESENKTNMTIFATATKSDGKKTSEEKIKFEKVRPSFLVGDKIIVIKPS